MTNMYDKTMKVNGLGCAFNMPIAVPTRKDAEGNEVPVSLPPHRGIMPYPVDEYPGCPDNWMHGSSKASSYFVPVEEGKGMWLDFNECGNHTHDVAVVVSVQGINPISGQKQDKLTLEQYRDKCPIHGCDFQQDRFCPECKRTWPAQNYLATSGTPSGMFWLDGFRNVDGQVRQYIFSAEEMRGVAAQAIGKDRVFAIGIAFFRSKEPHGRSDYTPTRGGAMLIGMPLKYGSAGMYKTSSVKSLAPGIDELDEITMSAPFGSGGASCSTESPSAGDANKMFFSPLHTPENWEKTEYQMPEKDKAILDAAALADAKQQLEKSIKKPERRSLHQRKGGIDTSSMTSHGAVPDHVSIAEAQSKVAAQKKLEVGAGGLINQQIHLDPKDPDYWEDEPAGFIYINYVTEEACETILAAGKREEKKEGFMEGMNVGAPDIHEEE